MNGWLIFGLLGWAALVAATVRLLRQQQELTRARIERNSAQRAAERHRQRLEVSQERLSIARELHDVVAHNLSLINVQSGMALQQVENNSAKAPATVAQIRTTSRNALEDVQALRHAIETAEPAEAEPEPATEHPRRAEDSSDEPGKRSRRGGFGRRAAADEADRGVGPTRRRSGSGNSDPEEQNVRRRSEPAPPPREPDPSLADLDALLRKPRLAGLTVHIRILGTAGPLPKAIDEAAARIVLESLSNTIQHAPGAEATVTVRYTPDSVDLTVDNTRPTGKHERTGPTRGMGIITMRQRTHALGGALTAGPKPSGGYRVAARLPSRPLSLAADPNAPARASREHRGREADNTSNAPRGTSSRGTAAAPDEPAEGSRPSGSGNDSAPPERKTELPTGEHAKS